MNPLEYLKKYKIIYDARDTRRRFIPLEKVGSDPAKYGFSALIQDLPDNYVSNAKQGEFINSKHKITAAICANRGGKSEALAIKCIKTLENIKVDKGGRYWVLTESFDLQKSGIQTKIKTYFKPERIDSASIANVKKDVYHSFTYVNKHGIKIPIDFKTYEQGVSKLQAAKLYGATFDEEPPEDIYDEVRTRTIDLNGKIDLGFTPLKGFTWSYKRILNARSSTILCLNWGMADNPFIPRNEIEDMKRDMSPKKAKMRLYGLYQGAEGMIYDSFDREKHVKKDLYDERFPVSVSVDWGIHCVSVGFFQERTVLGHLRPDHKENYLIDSFEMTGAGYGDVMKTILNKRYYIPPDEWFCDPAGSARSQATRTGVSLLQKIKSDFGIQFKYIKKLGVEESIDMVDSTFQNANGQVRFFIQEGIKLNDRGDTPEMRIEGYVRDENTQQPIKDGINDHFCDMLRYYIANKLREEIKTPFKQH
jgi:phage terminase large subunit-like protein